MDKAVYGVGIVLSAEQQGTTDKVLLGYAMPGDQDRVAVLRIKKRECPAHGCPHHTIAALVAWVFKPLF